MKLSSLAFLNSKLSRPSQIVDERCLDLETLISDMLHCLALLIYTCTHLPSKLFSAARKYVKQVWIHGVQGALGLTILNTMLLNRSQLHDHFEFTTNMQPFEDIL